MLAPRNSGFSDQAVSLLKIVAEYAGETPWVEDLKAFCFGESNEEWCAMVAEWCATGGTVPSGIGGNYDERAESGDEEEEFAFHWAYGVVGNAQDLATRNCGDAQDLANRNCGNKVRKLEAKPAPAANLESGAHDPEQEEQLDDEHWTLVDAVGTEPEMGVTEAPQRGQDGPELEDWTLEPPQSGHAKSVHQSPCDFVQFLVSDSESA